MANQERIDDIIDVSAIKGQKKEVEDLLNSLASQITKFPSLKAGIEGAKNFKELAASQKELQATFTATATITGELKIKSLELSNAKKQLAIDTQKERNEAKKLNDTKRDSVKAAREEAAVKKMEQQIVKEATNEYFQLNKALQDAELKYKNLALTQGFSAKATKEALANAVSIRKVLNQVDQSLGNYQRNVGNYGSSFNGLGASIQQILREAPSAAVSLNTFFLAISNNLPMLFDEINKVKAANAAAAAEAKVAAAAAFQQAEAQALAAGASQQAAKAQGEYASKQILANSAQAKAVPLSKQIFQSLFSINSLLTVGVLALTLYGGKIADFVTGLFKGSQAISEMEANQKALNDAFKGGKDAYVQATVEVSNLRVAFSQAREGIIKKEEAVKLYNDTIGKTTGEVKTLDEAEQALARNADAYIKFTLYKAAANIALQKSAEKLFEGMENSQKKALTQEGQQIAELDKQIKAAYGTDKYLPLLNQRRLLIQTFGNFNPELEKEGREIEKEQQRQLNVASEFTKMYNAIAKEFKFDFNAIKDPTKDKASSGPKEVPDDTPQRILQSQFEINKTLIENEAEAKKQLLESDKTYYSEKLAALREFGIQQAALIDLELQYQKASEEISYQQRLDDLKKQQKEKGADIKALKAQEVKEEEAHNKKMEELEVKAAQKLINLGYQQVKEEKKILDKKEQDRQDGLKQFEAVLQDQEDAINRYYNKIKTRDEKEKEEAEKRTKDMVDATKAIYQNLYKDVQSTFFAFLQAGIEREEQTLNERQRLLDEETAKRINNINMLGLSEVERTRQIAIVEKNAAAQTEQIEKRKRALAVQRARFEKAAAAASIIADTGIAVIRALGDKLVPYPVRVGYAIAAGALGALNLAKVLAAPLPKYRTGRGKGKDELAITGDGGKHEPILRGDGTIEMSPDRPTVTWLNKDDMVFPDIQSLMMAVQGDQMRNLPAMAINVQPQNDPYLHKLLEKQNEILKAINNKPPHRHRPLKDIEQHLNHQEWIKKHFKS